MITRPTRSIVSFTAALTAALVLAGCASGRQRPASGAPDPAEEPAHTLRFDNAGHDYVHVYLVDERHEWLLGRVEIGARANLRIPEDALTDAGPMRLAVLEGQHRTLQLAGDSRAATTLGQPIWAILSKRWTFSETTTNAMLTSLPRDPVAR